MTEKGHESKIYGLTGPELLSTPEQVQILARTLGRKIDCIDVPPAVVAEEMSKKNMPPFLIDSLAKMWQAIADGDLAGELFFMAAAGGVN